VWHKFCLILNNLLVDYDFGEGKFDESYYFYLLTASLVNYISCFWTLDGFTVKVTTWKQCRWQKAQVNGVQKHSQDWVLLYSNPIMVNLLSFSASFWITMEKQLLNVTKRSFSQKFVSKLTPIFVNSIPFAVIYPQKLPMLFMSVPLYSARARLTFPISCPISFVVSAMISTSLSVNSLPVRWAT